MSSKVTPITAVTAASPTAPTPDARQKRREAHSFIEETYDVGAGQYKNGLSDHEIAKAFGLSVEWVARRREEEFGPLKPPTELQVLKKDLGDLQKKVGLFDDRIAEYFHRHGWPT